MVYLRFRFCAIFIFILWAIDSNAQGDLLITPKRLIFDGSQRTQEINLANIGKDTATYNISFVQFKMDENGVFYSIPDTDTTQKFANKNLRFFPRTVTLAPNEAQSVKVQLIKSNELAPGEYRSHLFFKNVLNKTALGEDLPGSKNDTGITVSLKPVYGISIATIIHIGEAHVTASLSQVKFSKEGLKELPAVHFKINRSGNFSIYGDIKVNYVLPGEKPIEVALMRGVAVYTPNPFRNIKLPLNTIPGIDFSKGSLHIEFTDPANKNRVISEIDTNL